jgi:DNA-binding response OmpR family regulator
MSALCPACGFNIARIERVQRCGSLVVDLAGTCTWNGSRLALTPAETAILHALVAADGAAVKREALANVIDCAGRSNVVTVMICRLRSKFKALGATPIETIGHTGYRWRIEA